MGDDFELQDFLPYLLNQAAETLSLEFQKTYRRTYGMLRTEWRVLFHLGAYGAMTATEVCTRARLHKTKVSRAVAALEAKRYLTRETRDTDRRQASLALTPQGARVFADLRARAQAFDSTIRADLGAAEAEALTRALRRIADL